MWKVYVGNLDYRVRERELADEFRTYGNVRSVWVARNPPGYAFVEFDDRRDAEDSVSALDGKHGWRVEMSRKSVGGGGGRSRAPYGSERCYDCGAIGHFARECRSRGSRYSHRRSPSPLYRRSDSHSRHSLSRSGRDSSISPRRDRHRSYRERSSPRRKRERSRSLDSDGSEGRGHRSKGRRHSISPEHDKSDALSPQRNDREKSRSPQNDSKREERESSRSPENEPDIREASPLVKEGSKSPPRERPGELGDFQKEKYKQNGAPVGEESDMEGDVSPELRDDSRSPQAGNVGSYADGDGSPVLRDDSRSSLRDNVGSFADGDESPALNRSPRPDNADKVDTYAAEHSPVRNGSSGSKSPQEDNNGSYPERSPAEEVTEQRANRESE